jgi:iron complex transport system ATP-binding protein
LHSEGKTLIFTTHDANFAYELASDIVLLKNGSLIDYGAKDKVVKSDLLTTLYDTQLTVTEINGQTIIY